MAHSSAGDLVNPVTTLFELRNIRKEYNDRQVLSVDQLSIEEGEILAIVGPSGSGKSTLLRILNFLEPATAGELQFDGQQVRRDVSLEVRRRVTTVFQRPQLLNRSVAANVSFGLNVRGIDANGRIDAALALVGLTDLADQAANDLSGGEMQRVALARALVIQPDVLLLDEPTANLDPHNVALIEKLVVEQNQSRETTVVLVTHNIFQARRIAHRCALLLDGRLTEVAATEQFFTTPQDPRTAAFVRGDMVY